MIEAVVTLHKGNKIMVVANGWSELSEQLDKLDVKKIDARQIVAEELRQGKYARLEEAK